MMFCAVGASRFSFLIASLFMSILYTLAIPRPVRLDT